MPQSNASIFSNASIDSISKHAEARYVEGNKTLINLAFKGDDSMPPVRLFSRQHHATKGVRERRLFGWEYVRLQKPADLLKAVQSAIEWENKRAGRRSSFGSADRKIMLETIEQQPVYHLVVRGADEAFAPPSDLALQKVPTAFFMTKIRELRETLFRGLFDTIFGAGTGESPLRLFQELMDDVDYTNLLREYFKCGDTDPDSERNHHLMSRYMGGQNFLNQVVKHDLVDLLDRLLKFHTPEVTTEAPWLCLAEPLGTFGLYKNTAFHEAAFHGRPECLRRLCAYSQRWGLNDKVLAARNSEDKELHLSALDMAKWHGNIECHNVLAPLFGKSPIADGRDQNPRESRKSNEARPRIEFSFVNRDGHEVKLGEDMVALTTVFLADAAGAGADAGLADQQAAAAAAQGEGATFSWPYVLTEVKGYMRGLALNSKLLSSLEAASGTQPGQSVGRCHVFATLYSVSFASGTLDGEGESFLRDWWAEMTPGQADADTFLFAGFRMWHCKSYTAAKDTLIWLRTVVRAAEIAQDHNALGITELRLAVKEPPPSEMDNAPLDSDALVEARVNETLDLVSIAGELAEKRGVFMDYSLNTAVRVALAGMDTKAHIEPVAELLALKYSILPYRFARDSARLLAARMKDDAEYQATDNERFDASLALVKAIEDLSSVFFDKDRLLSTEPRDVRENMDTGAIDYIGVLIRTWFSRWPAADRDEQGEGPADPWRHFSMQLLAGQGLDQHQLEFFGQEPRAQEALAAQVRAAYDKALCTAVRMHVVLQHAFGRWSQSSAIGQPRFFLDYVEGLIPAEARIGLPDTFAKLGKYRPFYTG